MSKRVAGGQTVQVYVTVQGNIIGNRPYADELGETIVQRILRALDHMESKSRPGGRQTYTKHDSVSQNP